LAPAIGEGTMKVLSPGLDVDLDLGQGSAGSFSPLAG
jgi:hypothetical protein